MKGKKFVIILCILLIIIFILFMYYFSQNNVNGIFESEDNIVNNTASNQNKSQKTSKNEQLSMITDYDEFFSINSIINKYYEYIYSGNIESLNNIQKQKNEVNVSNNYSESATYISKFIYAKGFENTTYYFVSGSLEIYDDLKETLNNEDGICFVIIVDENTKSYNIQKLDVQTVYDYAQNYNMNEVSEIQRNNDNEFSIVTYKETLIASYYINYYKNLLYLDTQKAYSMLDANEKEKYPTLELFSDNLETLYSKYDSNIVSHNITGDDSNKTYILNTNSNSRVTIVENSIMNFTVSIDF